MKTFLKVMLILVGVVVAVKLLPFTFAMLCAIAGVLGMFALLGLGAVAIIAATALALAVLFAPLWVPALVIVGIIWLIKKLNAKPAVTVA